MNPKFFQTAREHLKKLEEQFPGQDGVYMVSLESALRETKAGVICALTMERAARALTDLSYRLATPEEIEAYKAAQDKKADDIIQTEAKRSGSVNEALSGLLRAGMAAQNKNKVTPKTS